VVLATVALVAGACTSVPSPRALGTRGSAADGQAVGQPAPELTNHLTSVACPTPPRCVAVGSRTLSDGATVGVVNATTDGGTAWKTEAVPPGPTDLVAVTCADAKHCVAVGQAGTTTQSGTVVGTVDGGRRWSLLGSPSGAIDLVGVQCSSRKDCLAVATDGTTYWAAGTVDGGMTWQRLGDLPPQLAAPGLLSCTGPTDCIVAGYTPTTPGHGTGTLVLTSDGGATWSAAVLPSTIGLLRGVTCFLTVCRAVGTSSTSVADVAQAAGQLLTSTDGGTTWEVTPTPPLLGDAFDIACPAGNSCAAVGTDWVPSSPPTPIGGVSSTADGGTSWKTPKLLDLPTSLVSVACPTTTSCVAVGGDVIARITMPPPSRRGQGAHVAPSSSSTTGHPER